VAIGEWWNQVSGTVMHGLEVTAVGMLLVFFTLGLVILAMVLLTKLPWLQSKPAPQEPESETKAASPAVQPVQRTPSTPPQTNELAQVAAITVALVCSRRRSVRQVATTKSTRGSWRSYGRAHQLGL